MDFIIIFNNFTAKGNSWVGGTFNFFLQAEASCYKSTVSQWLHESKELFKCLTGSQIKKSLASETIVIILIANLLGSTKFVSHHDLQILLSTEMNLVLAFLK